MAVTKVKKANSLTTKNGKTRVFPLNIEQLEKLLTNARKKHVAMIHRRIAFLKSLPNYKAPVVAVEEQTTTE